MTSSVRGHRGCASLNSVPGTSKRGKPRVTSTLLAAWLALLCMACGDAGSGRNPAGSSARFDDHDTVGKGSQAPVQATYFISPQGNDSWSGTFDSPFASVNRARQAVAAINTKMTGDVVVNLRGGSYPLSQTLAFSSSDSGKNGHKVIYQAYSGETPILSGGREVSGWALVDAGRNVWRASVPSGTQTRQLYVNEARAVRARSKTGLPQGSKTATGYSNTDGFMQSWRNPSDIEFVYTGISAGARGWTEHRCGVQSIASTTITMKQPCFRNASSADASPSLSVPTFIENAYELLDEPGEWYLDRSAWLLYYIPRVGEAFQSASKAVVPVLETLVTGTSVSNVEFRGITFAYATWLRPNGNDGFAPEQADRIFVGTPATRLTVPGNLAFQGATNVVFEDNVFAHLGASGLALDSGSVSCQVVGNQFFDISATAVRIGDVSTPNPSSAAQDRLNSVVNNHVHDVPIEYRSAVGVMAGYVSGLTVRNNEIANLPYSAVSLGWGWGVASYAQNNLISRNHIYNYTQLLSDGGGIYTLSPQGTSAATQSRVSNNYIHGGGNPYGALYFDEGSAWIDSRSNVMSSVPWWLLINTTSTPGFILNHHINVQDNFGDGGNCQDNLEPGGVCANNAAQAVTFSNNRLGLTAWPTGAKNVVGAAGIEDPYRSILVNPAGRNLAAGRPAIASATHSNAYNPSMANDGSIGTGWSADASIALHWWQVDLGRPYRLSEIEVITRQDLDQPEPRRDFEIWASNNENMDLGHVVLAAQGSTPLPNQATFRTAVSDTTAYRYVAVIKTVPDHLYIGEVRVYGTELNLAARKPSAASSVFGAAYGPSMANDTNVTSGWSPTDGGTPWWRVDLGGAYSLSQIQIITRQDLDQPETRRNFAVWASNNEDMDLGHVVLGSQGSNTLPYQGTWTLGVNDATLYRYIAIVKTVAEYFFLGDVRVYGRDPNVALGKAAVASSQLGASGAPAANDGDVNTGWQAASSGNWWQVDLGRPYTLSQIQLATRQNSDQPVDRRTFKIWASNNEDMDLGHVVLGAHGNISLPFQGTYTTAVTDPTAYRYVAVMDASYIGELAIYGH